MTILMFFKKIIKNIFLFLQKNPKPKEEKWKKSSSQFF